MKMQMDMFSSFTSEGPATPPQTTVREEITQLRTEVARHISLYYELDKPEITDAEFDAMYHRLEKLEADHPDFYDANSPTQRVGGKASVKFAPVQHRLPMLSLDNCLNHDDAAKFFEKTRTALMVPKVCYTAEVKLDGLALELVYINGILKLGSTRGDGEVGEDVTENIKTIKCIPHRLDTDTPPARLEVRGEAYMLTEIFQQLNQERIENGEEPFANPRNAAAGALRNIDASECAKRSLSFFCYAPGKSDGVAFSSQEKFLDAIAAWGIPVNPLTICTDNEDEIIRHYERIIEERDGLPYEIDGTVLKVNDFSMQETLGTRTKHPRWATAWKFPPRQATTVMEDIEVQVGRTGVLTPVARLRAVYCGGVTVTNATLHNMDQIRAKDIRKGDTVVIERAADVIPAVVRSLKELRTGGEIIFEMPTHCPECGSPTTQIEGEVAIRCTGGINCPAQIKEAIKHFVARKSMDIDGMGEVLVGQLLEKGLIRNIADIYYLKASDIASLERQGTVSAANAIKAIEASKTRDLRFFIASLGIGMCGESTAKALASHFGTLENIMGASEDDLIRIDDVGPKVAKSIVAFFNNPMNQQTIARMLEAGVNPKPAVKVTGGIFAGKVFVFTGALTKFTRDTAKSMTEQHGGKTSDSVSKKTSYVVAGSEAGTKLEKAKTLGVTVLSEDEFLAMLP